MSGVRRADLKKRLFTLESPNSPQYIIGYQINERGIHAGKKEREVAVRDGKVGGRGCGRTLRSASGS